MNYFISPYFISEVSAAVVASICFKKYSSTALWPILLILWMAVVAETIGVLYNNFVYPNNHVIFNFYGFLHYIVFYYMIYGFVKNKKRQRIIIILSVVVLVTYILNAFYVNPIYKPLTYGKSVATIVMVIHLMYAAIEVLNSNAILNMRNSLPFFIFSGYLFIEITLIPVGFMRNIDLYVWPMEVYKAVRSILWWVLLIANVYFIFGFLWTKPSN